MDAVKAGREFPDLNQTLNIKEISDKKRMLIGDEMGMGKSASAIFSKEYLGVKQALVVVPSNVVFTWQNYLSDKVSDTGEQLGYFKEGKAPKIFVVEDLNSLRDQDLSGFDYILISQEKLNKQYVEELRESNFDMLIVDEIHKLKNIGQGVRGRGILELAEQINGPDKHLVLLSGTPVPNKIQDVAVVLKLLYPERFTNIEDSKLITSIIHGDLVDLRNLLVPRMQMKALRESVKMPELTEETKYTTLSEKERDIYEILLDDDELTADEKIRVFRKYLMNPSSVDPTPNLEGSKIDDVATHLLKVFETKDKVVMFVNSYVEGMIRGENSIIEKCELPPDMVVRVIEGEVNISERQKIQEELQKTNQKILLVVSGQTADVGVDFSPAQHVVFYNEPWTKYAKQQQTARVYRPGLQNDLTVTTSIVEGTIEEGIQEYIQLKYNAIQKLLKGIPITELEQDILQKAEKQQTSDVEGDVSLAKEWLNSPQNRLYRMFGLTKEIGEKNFHKFLLEHGEEYAECYLDMGGRGFQANTGRVVGALVDRISKDKGQDPSKVSILDIASGPEMLKTHIKDEYKDQVLSLDINPAHFFGEGKNRIVGSFLNLPFAENSVDYANLSLALHYSRFIPTKGEFERLKVLGEMNRVLKEGGHAVINLLHSLEFKDVTKFERVAEAMGFRVVKQYSGEISSGSHYRSNCVVLEKARTVATSMEELIEQIGTENFDGIKLREREISSLKNSKRVINSFTLNNGEFPIFFNEADSDIFAEEQEILQEGQSLKEKYGSIKAIPKDDIIQGNFLRIFNGRHYRLLKKSEKMRGFVDIR